MAKLFVGYVLDRLLRPSMATLIVNDFSSGLAWHTDDEALRTKFEEFGTVEEAVKPHLFLQSAFADVTLVDCRQRSRHRP